MLKISSSTARYPRLTLFSNTYYRGKKQVFRGNVEIRNLQTVGDPRSLKFYSTARCATLVLFNCPDFQGSFRVIRGSRNISNLHKFVFCRNPKSLIASNRKLTLDEIREIKRTCEAPSNFQEMEE